jgi:hypothetical protein
MLNKAPIKGIPITMKSKIKINTTILMTFLNINPRDRKNNKFSPTEEEYQGEKIIVIEIENEEIKSEKETK